MEQEIYKVKFYLNAMHNLSFVVLIYLFLLSFDALCAIDSIIRRVFLLEKGRYKEKLN